MRIRQLHLKNIGPFADEKIEFPPCPAKDKAEIHIFTGHNGSGKTTLLTALAAAFGSNEIDSSLFLLRAEEKSSVLAEESGYYSHNPLTQEFASRWHGKDASFKAAFDIPLYPPTEVVQDGDKFHLRIATHILDYTRRTRSKAAWRETKQDFAAFAFAGYRQVRSEQVEAIFEPKGFNPLSQALDFTKNYHQAQQLTVNQLIANNFSKKWIESVRDPQKSRRFAQVLAATEKAIAEITGLTLEFDLQTEPLNLVGKLNGADLEFSVLPDGLRSLISWIADLLCRVDLLKWIDAGPITEKKLILFLDEIEVHLHPAWQRKVLPVVQKLFKNSQIFLTTHSPFVVNSVDDAWVYKLELDAQGRATVAQPIKSEDGYSYSHILSEIFDVEEEFGIGVQADLAKFKELRNKVLAGRNGAPQTEQELLRLAKKLAQQSEELQTIVQFELRQINKRTGKNLVL